MGKRSPHEEAAVVENYLQYVNSTRNGQRTADYYTKKINEIQERLDTEELTMLVQLDLVQKIRNFEAAREQIVEDPTDEFREVIASYSKRKGISRAAWREMKVPMSIIREAGL
jgi:hypothetical protein